MNRWCRKLPPLRWLALVACASIILLWAASLVFEFAYIRPGASWNSFVRIVNGQVGIYSQEVPFVPPPTSHWLVRPISFGSDWTWDVSVLTRKTWIVIVPFWMILGVAVPVTALLWRHYWHRHLPGHCPRCRYDLTGNTTGTCPECGTLLPNTPGSQEPDSSQPTAPT